MFDAYVVPPQAVASYLLLVNDPLETLGFKSSVKLSIDNSLNRIKVRPERELWVLKAIILHILLSIEYLKLSIDSYIPLIKFKSKRFSSF